jgi:rare lipoprotein A
MKRSIIRIALVSCGFAAAASTFAQTAQAAGQYKEEGIASWYGAEFDGKTTASGEVFDSKLMTAAHPALPFGTVLRVTNTQNGKQTTVRVNDRGPYVPNRIIDVSRAAAEQLDMLATGTAPVAIEKAAVVEAGKNAPAIDQAPVPQSAAPVAAPIVLGPAKVLPNPVDPASGKRYRLQVGSYKLTKYAADAFERLKRAGLSPAYERSGDNYRVVVPEVGAADIERIAAVIGAAGFKEILAREIP